VSLATGTHTGGLMGMPAADRHISVEGVDVEGVDVEGVDVGRVADGQAQERWGGLNM
jgi:hypothetical protein